MSMYAAAILSERERERAKMVRKGTTLAEAFGWLEVGDNAEGKSAPVRAPLKEIQANNVQAKEAKTQALKNLKAPTWSIKPPSALEDHAASLEMERQKAEAKELREKKKAEKAAAKKAAALEVSLASCNSSEAPCNFSCNTTLILNSSSNSSAYALSQTYICTNYHVVHPL